MMKRERPRVSSTWARGSMRQLRTDIKCAVESGTSVMITGERGVGKTFVASLIHQRSHLGAAPFTILKCADMMDSVPDRRHGSEPGAPFGRAGLTLDSGTLLIEEIHKVPAAVQPRLQGFIEREILTRSDLRLMTACSTPLFDCVRSKQFPEDLFYRLNVIHLVIPALRDRPEDIPILFSHYLPLRARVSPPRLSATAWERLVNYRWPGNVRELKAVAGKVATWDLSRPVEPEDLPSEIGRA